MNTMKRFRLLGAGYLCLHILPIIPFDNFVPIAGQVVTH